jgi:cation diffusion facilitator CzcD-associated flavoprotein CzcO
LLSDARELANDQQVEVDVCILGAGPAGIGIARELIGNGGQSCCWRAAVGTWNAACSG